MWFAKARIEIANLKIGFAKARIRNANAGILFLDAKIIFYSSAK